MIIKKIVNYLLIIILLITASPLTSFGQTATPDASGLQMTINPENPEPFQGVTVDLISYAYDLDRSKITWFVNDVKKETNMGLKSQTVQAGRNGQKTIIKASVATPNDGVKEIEAFFIPSLVDLIYESLAYTPPFYKGKALNPNKELLWLPLFQN